MTISENNFEMSDYLPKKLRCEMVAGCADAVSYIDAKGYIYCNQHGQQRQAYQRCRKLRPAELNKLKAGGLVSRY